MIKKHKLSYPLYQDISYISTPDVKISNILTDSILNSSKCTRTCSIKNSDDLLTKIKFTNLPDKEKLFSFDKPSLFSFVVGYIQLISKLMD